MSKNSYLHTLGEDINSFVSLILGILGLGKKGIDDQWHSKGGHSQTSSEKSKKSNIRGCKIFFKDPKFYLRTETLAIPLIMTIIGIV